MVIIGTPCTYPSPYWMYIGPRHTPGPSIDPSSCPRACRSTNKAFRIWWPFLGNILTNARERKTQDHWIGDMVQLAQQILHLLGLYPMETKNSNSTHQTTVWHKDWGHNHLNSCLRSQCQMLQAYETKSIEFNAITRNIATNFAIHFANRTHSQIPYPRC